MYVVLIYSQIILFSNVYISINSKSGMNEYAKLVGLETN